MFKMIRFGFERKNSTCEHGGGGATVLTQVLSTYAEPHKGTTSKSSRPFWVA